jgi:hypothetical protein
MKIKVDTQGNFETLEKNINSLVSDGFKHILVFHGQGGMDRWSSLKPDCDRLLNKAAQNNINIFGGIFPGIFDNGTLMEQGSILAGIQSEVHFVTLEDLREPHILDTLKKGIAPIEEALAQKEFQTLFVFGDGFGELNLNLINSLNWLVKKYPINVLGGLTGRDDIKASHYTILTPEKIIQNGAVLAFAKLNSGIGVEHGWKPLPNSGCEITEINGCFIEEINKIPALDFYMDFITKQDPAIANQQEVLLKNPTLFFEEVAIKYPLGIIREQGGQQQIIDRTAVSVGADKSLQFSAEIPVGTKVCILHLEGNAPAQQCDTMGKAAQSAYIESLKTFPSHIVDRRVIIMDCFGRKKMVDKLGQNYEDVEFKIITADQKGNNHSPIGPLTFGEISSMKGGYVELHNKTAVVCTIEDE